MRKLFIIFSIFSTLIIAALSFYIDLKFLYIFVATGPIIILGTIDLFERKHTIMRNYPIVGRFRYIMEDLRPKLYQYFIESDTDGAPLNRVERSMVYQRAKQENDTTPFGTQFNINEPGYEWINHSLYPLSQHAQVNDLRVTVGGKNCQIPYSLSILNISAMSFGALSRTAVESLNWGAKIGNFAHNTGEGGVSPYHLKHGGDIIWQIGTGYFGCRDKDGNFDDELFQKQAVHPNIRMIEIKLSQGAKPGHGGILPGGKNTPEIAAIRNVVPGVTVFSPPGHSAFKDNVGMLHFIARLRELSGGKPVGIKLCVGNIEEFDSLVSTMVKTNIEPDYIAVDGGEGGTGSAPPEFTNSIGMALKDGLVAVCDVLVKYGLKQDVKVLCSGKIISGFDIVKAISMGADACYSARAMMLSLGCIQALECHKNTCPTGVATQDPRLYKGLVVEEKFKRVRNFHYGTLASVAEILAAAGIDHPSKLNRSHIWRRISFNEVKNYEQLFPYPRTSTAKAFAYK